MRRLARYGALALAVYLAATPLPALERAEPESLFQEANELFRQGNEASTRNPGEAYTRYQSAALRYERIIDEGGIRNAKLYYDLGNAYFQMGDIGRAILNYRRAEQLDPGDVNLQQNLAYARSRRADRLDERTEERVLKTVLFWHYDLSSTVRTSIFALAWAALWLGLAVRLRRPERVPPTTLVGVSVLAALFLGSLLADSYGPGGDRIGVVVSPETVARKGDGENYEPAFTEPLHAGAEFRLVESRTGWLMIELPDGRTAWIRDRDAALVAEPS